MRSPSRAASAREKCLRSEIVRVGQWMYEQGLIVAADGNLSARLGPDCLLITPSGLCKGMLQPDHLIVVDMDGQRVGPSTRANRDLRPTSETPMHLEAYRRRPEINAVVHAHPPLTVALSIAGVSLAECMVPEVIVTLGLIPTTQYATPSSEENARAIRDLIGGHDAIILQRHGTLTVGRDLLDAFFKLQTVEQAARITFYLKQLGGGSPLPPTQVEKLLELRQALGLARPNDATEFRQHGARCSDDQR